MAKQMNDNLVGKYVLVYHQNHPPDFGKVVGKVDGKWYYVEFTAAYGERTGTVGAVFCLQEMRHWVFFEDASLAELEMNDWVPELENTDRRYDFVAPTEEELTDILLDELNKAQERGDEKSILQLGDGLRDLLALQKNRAGH
jgi:hypothetical protein